MDSSQTLRLSSTLCLQLKLKKHLLSSMIKVLPLQKMLTTNFLCRCLSDPIFLSCVAELLSHVALLCFPFQILSDELGCQVDDIASMELNVCDTQPSCLGGANDEFIFSGRLDNLASSFCALRALIDACTSTEDLANEHAIRMVALFDNEEVITAI